VFDDEESLVGRNKYMEDFNTWLCNILDVKKQLKT
jgi:hypothetical protein